MANPSALLPIPDKLVVLTFDDGNKSDITFVAPILKNYGFGGTFYITEGLGFLKNKDHYLTWEEVAQLHEEGFEIGNHTQHHPNVKDLSKEEFAASLQYIDMRCREYGIEKPITFCYPGYHNDIKAVEVLTERGYHFARRGVTPEYPNIKTGGRGPVYDPKQDHPLLIPITGISGRDWPFEDLVWALEQARGGVIAVLTFHGVPALEHPQATTPPEAFEDYMKYLHEKGATVISVRDLEKYIDYTVRPADPYGKFKD